MHELRTKNIEVSQDQTYCLCVIFPAFFFTDEMKPSVSGCQVRTRGRVKDLYQHLLWQLPQLLWRLDSPVGSQGFLQFHPSSPWSGKTCAAFWEKKHQRMFQKKRMFCNSHFSDMKYRRSGDIEYTVDAVATLLFPPKVDN